MHLGCVSYNLLKDWDLETLITKLEQAGFDVNGMPAFFGRLQRATRLVENNAPAYLRTHPLSGERMADLENRAANVRYRQRADSREFFLVRGKIRSLMGSPRDAVAAIEGQIKDRRFIDEGSARFGLAHALLRARDFKRAEAELTQAKKLSGEHPMFDTLAARLRLAQGQGNEARAILTQSIKDNQRRPYLLFAYAETLQTMGLHREAVEAFEELARSRPRDGRVWAMQAKSYAQLDRRALQHRSQAEAYALQGSFPAAIEQLRLAQRAGDADFYLASTIDSRLRALRAQELEEKRDQREMR